MTDNAILIDRHDNGVVVVTLNRPDHLNALTIGMVQALRVAFDQLDKDRQCRAIVLTAAGRAFSAGFDLKESPLETNPVRALAAQELFGGTPGAIRAVRQPVIAAIPGAAVGAGFALALAADIRIATHSARFFNGAIKIGLSAGESGISYHLPRLIGAGRAFEIMLTGRSVAAEEALAIGLVTQLVDAGQLLHSALKIANNIAANSVYATTQTKRLMWQNLDSPSLETAVALENYIQTTAMMTEDFREGIQAFIEKRPPLFSNK